MNEPLIEQSDNPEYDANFLSGVSCLSESDYEQARQFFLTAAIETDPSNAHYFIYLSYLGLSDILIDKKSGVLNHNNHSSDSSLPVNPEVQLNLACAEILKGNRKLSVQAIHKTDGLKLSPENIQHIHSFFDIVGKREQNNDGSLKRNQLAHKSIGKMLRKRTTIDIEQIELFIKKTVKKRYQDDMLKLANHLLQ